MAKASFASNGFAVPSHPIKKEYVVCNIPTFAIFRTDGSRVPTLKKSFLIKEYVTFDEVLSKAKTLPDGTIWTLVFEELALDAIWPDTDSNVFCIISYQVHTYGNFAVVRVCKDLETTRNLSVGDISCLESP